MKRADDFHVGFENREVGAEWPHSYAKLVLAASCTATDDFPSSLPSPQKRPPAEKYFSPPFRFFVERLIVFYWDFIAMVD